jgi:hypothetical protein
VNVREINCVSRQGAKLAKELRSNRELRSTASWLTVVYRVLANADAGPVKKIA